MSHLRQIKDLINNMAREKGVNPQILLRNYMMERLLERMAKSPYKNNFILKGGMLVSSLVGVESRSTVDMDTTIVRKAVNMESVKTVLEEIIAMDIDDGVKLTLKSVDEIREEADYNGFRASVEARLDTARIPLKIDITTGDKITPKEVLHQYKLLIEERSIEIFSYNIETILAEKLETIVSRSIANTRMRDFYDIYILLEMHRVNINQKVLKEAIQATAESRGTSELFNKGISVIEEIVRDEIMKIHWERYRKKYKYTDQVTWNKVDDSLHILWDMQN